VIEGRAPFAAPGLSNTPNGGGRTAAENWLIARMPFGLNKQTLTIVARDDSDLPPLWVEKVEAALLGRAQMERSDDGLELTMFGRPEVVAKRIASALTSALGDEWQPALEVRSGAPQAGR
jgi:pimeloyl-ACP methyl ester carboxylesterase